MKVYYKILIITAILILTIASSYSFSESNTNILILNSYDSQNLWTKSQVKAIVDTLDKSKINYNLYVEYMDSKRFSDDTHLKQVFNYLYNKYINEKIDYIVATDDSAFSFLKNNSDEIFGDTKIVFSGLNYIYDMDRSKFTGVYEKVDISKNVEFALKLFPNTENIYLIGEDQDTTKSIVLEVDEYMQKSNIINFEVLLSKNVEFLKNSIDHNPENSIIFFTVFNMDDSGNYYSYKKGFNEIMSDTELPIFSFWSFYDGLDIVGGYVSDPYLCGVDAAEILLQLINGASPDAIDIRESRKVYKLNYDSQKKFGLSDINLDEDIEYINKSFSNFTLEKINLAYLFIIIILIGIIFYLLYTIYAYSKENHKLNNEKEKSHYKIENFTDVNTQKNSESEVKNG